MNSTIDQAGTIGLGDRAVFRLGFGASHVTGTGCWGPPADVESALRLLRRVIDLGINFIDTAASYGPYVSEQLIHDALYPYPPELMIATKAGTARTGPEVYVPIGRPEFLRQDCEMSLRRLGVDTLDLLQLHRVDPEIPLEVQVGALRELQEEGKVRLIGLSNVTVDQLNAARHIVDIASVQNEYNLANRSAEDVVTVCAEEGIAFIPWFPVANGLLATPKRTVREIARAVGATPAQVAIAWLLARSPVMIPIPGTGSVVHLEENHAAASLQLTQDQLEALDRLSGEATPAP